MASKAGKYRPATQWQRLEPAEVWFPSLAAQSAAEVRILRHFAEFAKTSTRRELFSRPRPEADGAACGGRNRGIDGRGLHAELAPGFQQ